MFSILTTEGLQYEQVDDLWVVCCYFNPQRYRSRLNNYLSFAKSITDSGLNFLTVECAFTDAPFDLATGPNVLQVRSNSILWQKERLLNLAITALPERCQKVAWLDVDIRFANSGWAAETSRLLEDYPLVQLFEKVIQLPFGADYYNGKGEIQESFAFLWTENRHLFDPNVYAKHAHPGMAWAARRDLLSRHALYDRCIVGGADHVMAHAMIGDFSSVCLKQCLGNDELQLSLFHQWAKPFYAEAQGSITYTPGTIVHQWHGNPQRRLYGERTTILSKINFDPLKDLRVNSNGCWEWNSDKPELHNWLKQYFQLRQEDLQ